MPTAVEAVEAVEPLERRETAQGWAQRPHWRAGRQKGGYRSAHGRACDASAVSLNVTAQRKKTHVTDVCLVDSAVDNMTFRGLNHLLCLL